MKKILSYLSFLIVLSPLAIGLSGNAKEVSIHDMNTLGEKTIGIESSGL